MRVWAFNRSNRNDVLQLLKKSVVSLDDNFDVFGRLFVDSPPDVRNCLILSVWFMTILRRFAFGDSQKRLTSCRM